LKTFASLRVHGTTTVSCITAQNPNRVTAVQPSPSAMVRAQIAAVFDELPPAAVKTGMLYSAAIVRVVADWFGQGNRPPLVVDPVMKATSRSPLLKSSALRALTDELLPLATLVTPNLDETKVLAGLKRVGSIDDMRKAARQINSRFGCAVLVKGGHLRGAKQAIDIYFDGQTEALLSAPFVRGISTHGTGCTYSAAITAYLALGNGLFRSVQLGKDYVTQAIATSYQIGRHTALNCF
jgi:hydroxymethylpyrimidine/phosphomethylpyrimidine kinase